MGNSIVIKMGGGTIGATDTTYEDVVNLSKSDISPVIVHGGGSTATGWLNDLGIKTNFVNGLRVTDNDVLKVVTAVLTGLVNKNIVAAIHRSGGRALGISGIDDAMVIAEIRNPELGEVGVIKQVDPNLILVAIDNGMIPVISPISLTPGPDFSVVNVNADSVAGAVANSLKSEKVIFLTDVPGVLDGTGKVIPLIYGDEVPGLIEDKIIVGGMIPKIEACLNALNHTGSAQIVDGRVEHSLISAVKDNIGTTIKKRETKGV
ncbi:MAG: acetylglutamate kinase [Dehalococcoidia bacterium]